MAHSIHDFKKTEKKILQQQFEQSRFFRQQQKLPLDQQRKPRAVDIFDFDSTLFLSPVPSPSIWDAGCINALTTENLIGPGWWKDLRSLQVIPEASEVASSSNSSNSSSSVNSSDQQQKQTYPDYSHFWNEDVVDEVKRSLADPDRMTVLLTGRRYHPFYPLIQSILASRGLDAFDIMGLRPDPPTVEPHSNPIIQDGLRYNNEPNIFRNTMSFKIGFILNLLDKVPTIKEINMWDDRLYHVKHFRGYLQKCVSRGILDKAHVEYVVPVRPKYNPTWQVNTIKGIIDSHNKAVNEFRRINTTPGDLHQLQEDMKKGVNKKKVMRAYNRAFHGPDASINMTGTGQFIRSSNLVSIRPVDRYYVLRLSKKSVIHLKEQFQGYFEEQLQKDLTSTLWERRNGEGPVFYGSDIILGVCSTKCRNALQNKYPELFDDSAGPVRFKVISTSKVSFAGGFFLKVNLLLDSKENGTPIDYLLPLWCKPSEYCELPQRKVLWQGKKKDIVKNFNLDCNLLQGKLSTYRLYTLNNLDLGPVTVTDQ